MIFETYNLTSILTHLLSNEKHDTPCLETGKLTSIVTHLSENLSENYISNPCYLVLKNICNNFTVCYYYIIYFNLFHKYRFRPCQ